MRENLEGKLHSLPRGPGVYLFRDEAGEVLYVGKAKSLRSRVRSYFQRGDSRIGTTQLAERIVDVDVIVTRTEAEALHLEQNLVKRHRPPFNIRLRDDKSFPYIAVTLADEYPRVMFTRERHRRGTAYFGPYANAKKVRETLDVLNRVFRFRPCEGSRLVAIGDSMPTSTSIAVSPHASVRSRERTRGDHRRRHVVPLRRHGHYSAPARGADAEAAGRALEEAARYRNRLFSIRHSGRAPGVRQAAVGIC
jgi:excinuclease ABC subunit C